MSRLAARALGFLLLWGTVIVLLLVVVSLTACGESKLDRGTVMSKVHEPAHDYTIFIPIKTGSICSGSGTKRFCSPIYTAFPFFVHDGEDWKLELHEGDKAGWDYVDQATWERTQIGDRIEKATTSDPSFDKRRK